MRIRPGHITFFLVSAFAVAVLGAVANPLFQTPAPASASVAAVHQVTRIDLTAEMHQLSAVKAAAMGRQERQAVQEEARQARLIRVRHRRLAAQQAAQSRAQQAPTVTSYPVSSGSYSYSQLEALWSAAGGPDPAGAACIAEHESSGNPDANNGAGDLGLWQVATSHDPGGNLFNPQENARIAVQVYYAAKNSPYDGYNGWEPWTTAPGCGL